MSVRCTSVYWDDNSSVKSAMENVENLKKDRKLASEAPANPIIRLLKPLLKAISRNRKPKQKKCHQQESQCESDEAMENLENERLVFERAHIDRESLVLGADLERMSKVCVPVHFVRTEVGTFFWTASVQESFDLRSPDLELSNYQSASPQCGIRLDRWAQA